MEEERIVWFGIFYQPFHSTKDVGFGGKFSGVPGIICHDQDFLWFKIPVPCRGRRVGGKVIYTEGIKLTHEEFLDVPGVVHATVQFPGRSCIVDSDLRKFRHRQF